MRDTHYFTSIIFMSISSRSVMGANDNLSGLATCYELAKYFSEPIHQPQSCEIWIAGYGCEEIGARGSKAFVKLHSAELHNASVVTLDMIGVKNGILLVEKGEIYGMVYLSKEASKQSFRNRPKESTSFRNRFGNGIY